MRLWDASTCGRRSTGSSPASPSSTASRRAACPCSTRRWALFDDAGPEPPLRFPFVVKPRYGSWGLDVLLCADERAYGEALARLRKRPWFAATGAVAQELVP